MLLCMISTVFYSAYVRRTAPVVLAGSTVPAETNSPYPCGDYPAETAADTPVLPVSDPAKNSPDDLPENPKDPDFLPVLSGTLRFFTGRLPVMQYVRPDYGLFASYYQNISPPPERLS
jgi:hypothetical protein